MESRKRRHFPDAFKREAVERVRTSGVTIIEVAEELGLHETVLRRWMRRFGQPETGPVRRPITQAQGPSPAELADRECPAEAETAEGRDGARYPKKPSRVAARLCAVGTPRATL